MSTVKKIIRNIGILSFSQVFSSIMGFVFLIYTARYLGETNFGKYNFALSFPALFLIIIDPGISQYIIREFSRDKKLVETYISNIYIIEILLSAIMIIITLLLVNLLNYQTDTVYLVFLFSVYTILNSFTQIFISTFQALEKIKYVAFVNIIQKIILMSSTLIIFSYNYSIIELAYVYILVGIIGFFTAYGLLKKVSRPKTNINIKLCKFIVKKSIPFGFNIFFGILLFRIDTVILSALKNDTAVGIYSAAYNPLMSLTIMMTTVIVSIIYPIMSKYYIYSKENLEKALTFSAKYIALIGFPISAGCIIVAPQIIKLLYENQYTSSVLVFQILSLFIPIKLLSGVQAIFLTSINKQNLRTVGVGLSVLLNIVLDILLIPHISYVGAGIATVISETFQYFIFTYYRNQNYAILNIHKHYVKPIIASLFIFVISKFIQNLDLIFIIIISSFAYFLILILLKTHSKDDLYIYKQLTKKD